MRHTTWLLPLTMATAAACSKPTPEQQIDQRRRHRARRPRSHPRRENARHRGRRRQRQPRSGHDARGDHPGVHRDRLQARHRPRRRTARGSNRLARRTSPTSRARRRRSRCSASTATSATTSRRTAPRRACRTPAARDRRADLYHHPLTIVRAALDPAAKLAIPTNAAGQNTVQVTTADGLMLTLSIDSRDEAAGARRLDDRQPEPRRRLD